ncbi:Zinc/iron permease [Geopyxis carbonaria]|nr:Zinc/iron permease [Geopyxis carbonaria]
MIPNDQRGWILASASGLACVVGACLINLDLALHIVPKWRSFSIQESTKFLAASLSLSFGVMFFSALFGLLPEARDYFLRGGYRPDNAGYACIGFFLLGVLGLQIISDVLHRCLPSSIVNCDDHGAVSGTESQDPEVGVLPHRSEEPNERTSLLERRPTLGRALTSVFTGNKRLCDANGKCHGYSDHLCALESGHRTCDIAGCVCVKKSPTRGLHRHRTEPVIVSITETGRLNGSVPHSENANGVTNNHHSHTHDEPHTENHDGHHHVAKNKYLSIGVQTSIAIALHKFPEGFITYATNHANPNLGFTVFLALFIHNIAEGFAMALPLYLAFQSRTKAVIWASLLGGFAQPVGAAIAWASIRGRDFELNTGLYGILFSITAGIMCSVGLQLFSQAIHIHHGSRLAFIFAFIGMGILGFSSALTAE